MGWVLSGPLPTTTGLFSTCFKAVTRAENDSILADQLRSWYDMESFGAYKQVDSRSAADAQAMKILGETTFNDGCRYQVGMLWADDERTLPNNYFSALVQLKSLERSLGKDLQLKKVTAKPSKRILTKGILFKSLIRMFRADNRREWYLPHHPVIHPHKPGKVRRVLNGAAKFHGYSLNNALLTGPDLLQNLIHIVFRFRQYPKDLLQSSWLSGPKFLKTNEWPFKPSEGFRLKLKQTKPDPTDEQSTESCTMLSETQLATAKTFEWQKYGSYEKLLRIAAYVLRLLSRNRDYRTNSCVITDPAELENSEQRLLYLTQAESFHAEKVTC